MPTPEEMIKNGFEEIKKDQVEFQKANDERLKKIESKGFESAEQKEEFAKRDAEFCKMTERLETLETRATREAKEFDFSGSEKSEIEKKASRAFSEYMSTGRLTPESEAAYKANMDMHPEYKALSVDSEPDGGFLVRPEVSNMMITKIFESSPVRQEANVKTISTDAFEEIVDFDEAASAWVGEQQSRTETDSPQLDKLRIPAEELYAMPKATQKLLDDAAINIETWLADHVSRKFARAEATAFVTGDGNLKPRGFTTYADGTAYGQVEQVISGHATLLTGNGLIDLQTSLFEEYQPNAKWMMKRATLAAVRKLKDGNDQYLLATMDGLKQDGRIFTLLGKDVRLANDMADVGASSLSVAYADWRQAYCVVDRVGIRVLRDPYSSKPNILFYTTKRVGGAVANSQAIKLQVTSA